AGNGPDTSRTGQVRSGPPVGRTLETGRQRRSDRRRGRQNRRCHRRPHGEGDGEKSGGSAGSPEAPLRFSTARHPGRFLARRLRKRRRNRSNRKNRFGQKKDLTKGERCTIIRTN